MAKQTPKELGQMFHEAFETNELTTRQLWAITVFAKYVRLRARNNSAFNNLCNGAFPYAQFKQVTKFHKDGTSYPGLAIQVKDAPAFSPDEEAD